MGAPESYELDDFVIPSSLLSIVPILSVANEIENEHPRVAYLCRFYTYEKVHRLDPSVRGRGVGQFKISLLQRLERDNLSVLTGVSKRQMHKKSRAATGITIPNTYRALDQGEQADRAELGKAYKTSGVLFGIMRAVNDGNNNTSTS